jgi:hypothetical protein
MPKFQWATGPVVKITVNLKTPEQKRMWRLYQRYCAQMKRDMDLMMGKRMLS